MSNEKEFDFKAWLVAQGWKQRFFHTFVKANNGASFSIEFEDRDFGSETVEAKEIIQCWLRNNNNKIFDSCDLPTTQQEAETLFKLFRL